MGLALALSGGFSSFVTRLWAIPRRQYAAVRRVAQPAGDGTGVKTGLDRVLTSARSIRTRAVYFASFGSDPRLEALIPSRIQVRPSSKACSEPSLSAPDSSTARNAKYFPPSADS